MEHLIYNNIGLDEMHNYHPRSLFYLASPYTHSDPEIRRSRALAIESALVACFECRLAVFAPIFYTSELSLRHELPYEAEFWWNWSLCFMERAAAMIVLTLDGWKQSTGVNREIGWFLAKERPIYLMSPDDVQTLRELD